MKSGYDQFFQNARKVAEQQGPRIAIKKKVARNLALDMSSEDVEEQLRRRLKMTAPKRKRKATIPWKIVSVSFLGFLAAIWGFQNHEEVESLLRRVEFQMTGEAMAQAPAAPNAPAAPASAASAPTVEKTESVSTLSEQDVNHLKKLNERKKELDAREEELNRVENELQVQRVELEKRLKELEEMRSKISGILED
ncbi:MAG: hypothetical protein AAGB31_05210, partial [Bdellovibrio sp.]